MPQPDAVLALSDNLRSLYAGVQTALEAEQRALAADPRQWRRHGRLKELLAEVDRLTASADETARTWVTNSFPRAYSLGAIGSARAVGDTFNWTTPHIDAVTQLANDLFDDLLKATDGVRASAKALVRTLAREQTAQVLLGGETATKAGGTLADLLRGNMIHAVRYRDGSLHDIGEYAQLAIRTKSATAYSLGSLAGAPDVDWWTCFDNPACGLDGHDDPEKPNGGVFHRDTAAQFPISHVNCVRGWGPRPDITSAEQAKNAASSTTPEQDADQAAVAQARAEQVAARSKRRARQSGLERRQERLVRRAAKVRS